MDWEEFISEAPDRVVEAIEKGPHPLKEYGSDSLTFNDKDRGLQRFKGGTGRGSLPMKTGSAAVVYFDPDLAHPDKVPDNIPDEVLKRHSKRRVLKVFEEL